MADLTHDATDQELVELFSAFDEIVASDELISSTLGTIFAQLGAEADDTDGDGRTQAVATTATMAATTTAVPTATPTPGVVETDDAPLSDAPDTEAGPTTTGPALTVVGREGKAIAHSATRRHGIRLRMAAAIAAVSIVAAGGIAYALPASHVRVTEGGTTIDLGVNVFGRTVSVTTDSEDGREVLEGLDIYHKDFDDALGLVIDRMGERGDGDGSVHIRVESPFGGQRDDLDSEATRVIGDKGFERGDGGRAPGTATNAANAGGSTAKPTTNVPATKDVQAPATGTNKADPGAPDNTDAPAAPAPTSGQTTSTAQPEGGSRTQSRSYTYYTNTYYTNGQGSRYSQGTTSPTTVEVRIPGEDGRDDQSDTAADDAADGHRGHGASDGPQVPGSPGSPTPEDTTGREPHDQSSNHDGSDDRHDTDGPADGQPTQPQQPGEGQGQQPEQGGNQGHQTGQPDEGQGQQPGEEQGHSQGQGSSQGAQGQQPGQPGQGQDQHQGQGQQQGQGHGREQQDSSQGQPEQQHGSGQSSQQDRLPDPSGQSEPSQAQGEQGRRGSRWSEQAQAQAQAQDQQGRRLPQQSQEPLPSQDLVPTDDLPHAPYQEPTPEQLPGQSPAPDGS